MVNTPIIYLSTKQMPFVKMLLVFIIGIVLARAITWTPTLLHYCWIIAAVLFIVLFLTAIFKFLRRWMEIVLYLIWFALAVIQFGRSMPESKSHFVGNSAGEQWIGRITDEPICKMTSCRFPVELRGALDSLGKFIAVSGKVMLTVYPDTGSVNLTTQYGDIIQFSGSLNAAPSPKNPHEFDYKAFLANRGIYHQQRLPSDQLRIIKSQKDWYSYVLMAKRHLVKKFKRSIPDHDAFSVASALVFGYRAEMNPEVYNAFVDTGTIHVLSVSGMHVSMVFIMLSFLLKPIDHYRQGKNTRFALTLLLIWSYVILTGMAPPIMRSGIMISCMLLAQWIGRQTWSLNALFVSALLLLFFNPKSLFDVGFQLSYLAMIGIFVIFPMLRALYLPRSRWWKTLVDYCYISIAAQMITTPLTLFYFGQFPNYFLLANLLVSLPATLIMYAGVGLMLIPIDFVSQLFGEIERVAVTNMVGVLRWISNLPGAITQGVHIDGIQLVLLFSALITLFIAFNYRRKMMLFIGTILLFIVGSSFSWQYIQKQNYRGIHIYQTRHQLAIAWFDRDEVTLFSTFDSLNHSTIQYQVMANLKHYRGAKSIRFQPLPAKENILLKMGKKRISIWNTERVLPNVESDLILIRNNRALSEQVLRDSSFYILDGSSSDTRIVENETYLTAQGAKYYTLKDNYAYVWKTN
ncbi:ComEC/Rec2 family competence protein [Sphingobacterium corticis]|uniref:ComEC/Rec2 family competence protein n=1 Tax=Sphingobacterium corticis TaxID=1812823 RepID=A0ABW5NDW5_9SPHI